MKTFEIGKTYETRSACNHECVFKFTIAARTAATVTAVDDHGEFKKYRISKKYSTYRDAETFLPFGEYSMCPMISAE